MEYYNQRFGKPYVSIGAAPWTELMVSEIYADLWISKLLQSAANIGVHNQSDLWVPESCGELIGPGECMLKDEYLFAEFISKEPLRIEFSLKNQTYSLCKIRGKRHIRTMLGSIIGPNRSEYEALRAYWLTYPWIVSASSYEECIL